MTTDQLHAGEAVRASLLPFPAKLIVMTLAHLVERELVLLPVPCDVSRNTLAEWTGLNRSTIARYLPSLVADGWVTRTAAQSPANLRRRLRYHNGGAGISVGKRQRIYARDGYRCVKCGAGDDLTIDHIHPRFRGGGNEDENLRTLCRSCNSAKGARPDGP
jgi:hypothetical protein